MSRKSYILVLIGFFTLTFLPDLLWPFLTNPPPIWVLKWPLFGLICVWLIYASVRRLKDAGHATSLFWLALGLIIPIYALFASPLTGLVPLPDVAITMALVVANGIVFGGLAFLCFKPSYCQ
jgi:uncharacterized membrane protein YhaH (DUF805 family)